MTQEHALSILKTGANVFLTGEPGSGKTYTINSFVSWLREHGIQAAITASTGIAATHIGGYTIHSWSGIGVREQLSERDLDAISQNKRVVDRISQTSTLIIDEISMLSANTISMVDMVCQTIRRNTQPFGGLQVVLVGDFFQLPPVQKRNQEQSSFETQSGDAMFAFNSHSWKSLNLLVCYLTEQHRHADNDLLDFLSAIRSGSVDESHLEMLQERFAPKAPSDITHLYSHNVDVNALNDKELAALPGKAHTFTMTSRGAPPVIEALQRGCLSPEKLVIKIGARVMFTKNDPGNRYANGTLGTVTGFSKEENYPLIETHSGTTVLAEPAEWRLEDAGRIIASIEQIPLRLAWAITVHKSQGMSLDAAHMNLAQTFEYGQGYVALSRVRTFAGLSLAGLNQKALEVHPAIRKEDAEFRMQSFAVEDAFAKIPETQLRSMHHNFIKACGGSIDPVQPNTAGKRRVAKESTYAITKKMVLAKESIGKIATERNLTEGTIVSHLERLVARQEIDAKRDLQHLRKGHEVLIEKVQDAAAALGSASLTPIHRYLKGAASYEEIRFARLFLASN